MASTANHQAFNAWSTAVLGKVEKALSDWVAPTAPERLGEAMRYAVLDGGKRLRPLLVFAAAQAVGAESNCPATLRAACAVELIHAYSLVHDDMPCMDNDVLRRGKPTVHVKFGQAQALLAGDALQALAFELLTPTEEVVAAATQAKLCRLLALSAGCHGMAGGQAIDLANVGQHLNLEQLKHMHKLKTGALLQASVMMGAACVPTGQTVPMQTQTALQQYGAALGVAFQVVDDILDVTTDTATLGKTAGKDAQDNKPTFVSLMGLEKSSQFASQLLQQALIALDDARLEHSQALRSLAHMVVNRIM
ncbi:MAG TPA: polyprenyl synthetase family protein [Burkholderiaceae bacterium]|nr:polyprenyl synthetase family protein [Burkholderiaceae bacterium]